jgi:hypothetical protein
VSQRYSVAAHLCACGCGEKVVTPLSPAEWQVRVQGGLPSLHPSIGNWSMACRSHYWIRNGRIVWSGAISKRQMEQVFERDRKDIELQHQRNQIPAPGGISLGTDPFVHNTLRRAIQAGVYVGRYRLGMQNRYETIRRRVLGSYR